MQYAILFYETPGEFARRTGPDAAAYWSTWGSYFAALGDRTGSGACLQGPQTGAVVRVTGQGRTVHDGPHADSTEPLGGFAVIEADSMSAALEWAERSPAASAGAVEVRPVLPMKDISEMRS